ncbi:DUF4351 domain-containing protein [Coleofasciculus sp. F4-SAH-05]|uniref:DUF4351 domain-containing protein n=1 Tax=Coleofasciculus sp. F4-SAH-05 TaxID=3069525 RepID=UPI0032F2822A
MAQVAEQVARIPNRQQRQNISGCTEILAGLRFEKDLIRRFLREDMMRGSVIYQDILQQGIFSLIRRLIERRLGKVEPALLEGVRELSPEQLEALGVALLDFSATTDLAAWLDQQQPRAGEVNLIIRQLKRRLGEVEPVLIERVRRLPIVQLEALAEALLDFADMADLVGWLEQVQ